VKSATAEDARADPGAGASVVIVPGYGMAVAQAQHRVRELYDQLTKRGVDVRSPSTRWRAACPAT
jgi:H+-translocating NAD(P) transhydrogenase subunit beta